MSSTCSPACPARPVRRPEGLPRRSRSRSGRRRCCSPGAPHSGCSRRTTAAMSTARLPRSSWCAASPYYFGGWVQMLDQRLYPGWGEADRGDPHEPPDHVGSGPAELAVRAARIPAMLAVFWEAMHSLSTFTARALGEAVDLTPRAGCSTSAVAPERSTSNCAGATRDLSATVYELPKVDRDRGRKDRGSGPSRADRVRVAATSSPTPPCPAGTTCILLFDDPARLGGGAKTA